jgi:hypothetical protein
MGQAPKLCHRCEKHIGEDDMRGVVTMSDAAASETWMTDSSTKTYVLCRSCYKVIEAAIASVSTEPRRPLPLRWKK